MEMLIGGRWQPAASGRTEDVTSPFDGTVTGTVPATVPSNGEVTSSVRPLAAGCHIPPISISMRTYSPVHGSGSCVNANFA